MARTAGKMTKLSEKKLKVYLGDEQMRYLKWLYLIKKKKHGEVGSYSMSRFVREIISLYILDHWAIVETTKKAFSEAKKGNDVANEGT